MNHSLHNYRIFSRLVIGRWCSSSAKCWNCSKVPNSAFFCESCNKIQPTTTSNYFHYIGLPKKFEVDEHSLKKKFHKLHQRLHPDKFAHATDMERQMSEEHSRKLNAVMRVLGNSLERAKYILETESGLKIEEAEKSYLDPDELMEVLDWQESIAEMEDECMLQEEKSKVDKEIKAAFDEMAQDFSSQNWSAAKRIIVRLQYLDTIRNAINLKIEKSFSKY